MTSELHDNESILFKKLYIRADSVNDIGLDIEGISNIKGDIIPTADKTYNLGSATKAWKDVYIGPGSLYINNKKIISDESDTINISTDINQNLKIKTSGTGTLQLESTGTSDISLTTTSGITGDDKSSGTTKSSALVTGVDLNPVVGVQLLDTSQGSGYIVVNHLKVSRLSN